MVTPPSTILLLGDSLTQTGFEGWVGKLAHLYQRRADVINRGCSGYTTEFYFPLLPTLPPASTSVSLVVIFFGANDAALATEDPHHHVPLESYKANLEKLIQHVQTTYPTSEVLLLTPPALDHKQRLQYQVDRWGADKATGKLERTNDVTKTYAQACQAVGSAHNIPVVDVFTLFLPHTDKFLSDGLHFSPDGHTAVYEAIVAAIAQHYPALSVSPCPVTGQPNNSSSSCEALPSWGPYHDHIAKRPMK